ncbi:MAG TPA: tetratricopeptide repeat protein [Polyangiaceae bacterium]|nr:tetratricopeptide repeat protein [Polyangiaceae bacterium]
MNSASMSWWASLWIGCSAAVAMTSGLAFAADSEDTLLVSYQLEAKGDLAGALRASHKLADKNPKQYFARLRAAYLALAAKNFVQAARDYEIAAALAPKAIEPLLGQQQALMALGKYGEAEPIGRAAVERDPLNYLANSRLAWTLFSLKKYAEAARVYSRVLALYPGDIEMAVGLGYAELRSGQKQRAQETFRAVLGMAPKHVRATQGLAEAR